ncbi:F0F1 ATP synthase subunit delta [Quadrisphaera sp. DSM 44207]|uniref:F0F1 ATP synthase subunit delta n=1 Tax=Quadrisphaera sp. DSM 44207 TaxID=1881057 RepID=UPI000887822F|nr:F0F1 ATP synthase subunit delta [Quadrisphaera sp. DSM 44207]SDQ73531.1 F-type H+-transporting ATPase subunit delta [Quadrisphaera sp. DSM 44207]
MRGQSRDSLAAADDRLEALLPSVDAGRLGEELFAVVRLLDSSAGLRRAVTDPAREEADRAALVTRLLRGQVQESTADVVAGVVRQRWSEPRDLVDALERLGTVALLASAEQQGALETLEEEVFRFSRLVAADDALARALGDRTAAPERRGALVDRLLAGRALEQTRALVRQAVVAPRGRRLEAALQDVLELAARRRQRLVAVVTAASPLTPSQQQRLAAALGRVYGRGVLVEVDVDPEVLGGVRVQVGDEVLDATVVSRLAEARRRLAG